MANWASTSYCIEGSKEDLKKIFKAIDGFMTEKRNINVSILIRIF